MFAFAKYCRIVETSVVFDQYYSVFVKIRKTNLLHRPLFQIISAIYSDVFCCDIIGFMEGANCSLLFTVLAEAKAKLRLIL